MIAYNELSRAACYDIIGDDDLYLVENLNREEKVLTGQKVEDGVKIVKDKSLGLVDCSVDVYKD